MLTPEQIAAEALAKYLAEQNGGGSSATTYGAIQYDPHTNQYFQMGSNGIRRNVGTPASPPQPSQDAQALAAYYLQQHHAGNPQYGQPSGVAMNQASLARAIDDVRMGAPSTSPGLSGWANNTQNLIEANAALSGRSTGPTISSRQWLANPDGSMQLYYYYSDGTSEKATGEGSSQPAPPPGTTLRNLPNGDLAQIDEDGNVIKIVAAKPPPQRTSSSGSSGGGGSSGVTSHTSDSTSKNYSFRDPAELAMLAEQFALKHGLDQAQVALNAAAMGEQTRQFDITTEEGIRQFEIAIAEGVRKFDVTTAEGQRQFDFTRQDSIDQFNQTFAEGIRRFDISSGEGTRQFDLTHGLQEQKFQANIEESLRDFGIADRNSRVGLANALAQNISTTDPAAFEAFWQGGGGNIVNALGQGGTAVSDRSLLPAATLLQAQSQLGAPAGPGAGPQPEPDFSPGLVPTGPASGPTDQMWDQGQGGSQPGPINQPAPWVGAESLGLPASPVNQPPMTQQPTAEWGIPRYAYGTNPWAGSGGATPTQPVSTTPTNPWAGGQPPIPNQPTLAPNYTSSVDTGFGGGNEQLVPKEPQPAAVPPTSTPTTNTLGQPNQIPYGNDNPTYQVSAPSNFPTSINDPRINTTGYTTATAGVTGDAPAANPYAGGARPELFSNPTGAPVSFTPTVPPDQSTGRNLGYGGFTPQMGQAGFGIPQQFFDQARTLRTNVGPRPQSLMNLAWQRAAPTVRDLNLGRLQSMFGIPQADARAEINRWVPRGLGRGGTTLGL